MGLFLISLEWTANARVCPYVSFCNGFAFKYCISWTQCPANRINWKINAYRFYFLLLACFSSKSFCPSLQQIYTQLPGMGSSSLLCLFEFDSLKNIYLFLVTSLTSQLSWILIHLDQN